MRRTIVLLGIGHTNAHVVRMWGEAPLPDTDLICVSDFPIATYSGMLPAVFAGQHDQTKMQIDLVQLCESVGAKLVLQSPSGLDRRGHKLLFENRPPIHFDALSIGIGSTVVMGESGPDDGCVVKVKPMQTLLDRLESKLQVVATKRTDAPIRVVVVGGGAASVEVAFCLPQFLKRCQPQYRFEVKLISREKRVVSSLRDATIKRVERELKLRGVDVLANAAVVDATDDRIVTSDGLELQADLVICATGAAPPSLLQRLHLPLDHKGYLSTDKTLRSVSGEPIFAVGDSGSIVGESLPKSGVYAVRQGPVLWQNLQNELLGAAPVEFHPQRDFLKLLNLGNGSAIGQWKGMSFQGRWVYRLKNRIDERFLAHYQHRNSGIKST